MKDSQSNSLILSCLCEDGRQLLNSRNRIRNNCLDPTSISPLMRNSQVILLTHLCPSGFQFWVSASVKTAVFLLISWVVSWYTLWVGNLCTVPVSGGHREEGWMREGHAHWETQGGTSWWAPSCLGYPDTEHTPIYTCHQQGGLPGWTRGKPWTERIRLPLGILTNWRSHPKI